MRKSALFILLIGAVSLLLNGCIRRVPEDDEVGFRVVVGVTVSYENGPISAQRVYTSDSKMQRVLDYLRLIDPYGTPQEDPEATQGSDYRITLYFSDGSQTDYRQKSDRYMRQSGGKWKKIDPSQADELGRIMGQLESDEHL